MKASSFTVSLCVGLGCFVILFYWGVSASGRASWSGRYVSQLLTGEQELVIWTGDEERPARGKKDVLGCGSQTPCTASGIMSSSQCLGQKFQGQEW